MNETIQILTALLLAPLLPGLLNKVKAFFCGKNGPPVFQLYYELVKLAGKTPVYSRSTTQVFSLGPIVSLAALLCVFFLLPFCGRSSVFSFNGDFILLAGLLALARFAILLAALDTGSSFEGMGASREAQFAVFAEPAFFLAFAALARSTGRLSLAGMFSSLTPAVWLAAAPILALITASLIIIFLTENSRMPVDDPNTHLELTMIHEVICLDHSGPDLALIQYGAALKYWIYSSFIASIILPRHSASWFIDASVFIAAMFSIAVLTGVAESCLARLRLLRIPYLLMGASVLSVLAFIFQLV